ncbi:uncharacterized protein NPIL_492571 [Nephila pilipes]|uniref:Uncharacterized protein n=1 Tax=Nephila pilipes TaxID=299642 RepID=A0A8X6TYQ8_NEPPI|nr:uncharacterized protein NPIL_492571 [Nephila pilipes]
MSEIESFSQSDDSDDDLPTLQEFLQSTSTYSKAKTFNDLFEENLTLSKDQEHDQKFQEEIRAKIETFESNSSLPYKETPIYEDFLSEEDDETHVSEEPVVHFFGELNKLQFFTINDVTLLKCGFDLESNLSKQEKFLSLLNENELYKVIKHGLCDFSFCKINQLDPFIKYVLRSMSLHNDETYIKACQKLMQRLFLKSCKPESNALSNVDVFMILFNYGVGTKNREIFNVPGVKEITTNLDEISFKLPKNWIFNLKNVLSVLKDLINWYTFKNNDLYCIIIYLLWMSMDDHLQSNNIHSELQGCIALALSKFSDEFWPDLRAKIAQFLMLENFSWSCKWSYILKMTKFIPYTVTRGVELRKYISYVVLKRLTDEDSHSKISFEYSDDLFSMSELLPILESICDIEKQVQYIAIKFIDIFINHLKLNSQKDFSELSLSLRMCENSLGKSISKAQSHLIKMHSRVSAMIPRDNVKSITEMEENDVGIFDADVESGPEISGQKVDSLSSVSTSPSFQLNNYNDDIPNDSCDLSHEELSERVTCYSKSFQNDDSEQTKEIVNDVAFKCSDSVMPETKKELDNPSLNFSSLSCSPYSNVINKPSDKKSNEKLDATSFCELFNELPYENQVKTGDGDCSNEFSTKATIHIPTGSNNESTRETFSSVNNYNNNTLEICEKNIKQFHDPSNYSKISNNSNEPIEYEGITENERCSHQNMPNNNETSKQYFGKIYLIDFDFNSDNIEDGDNYFNFHSNSSDGKTIVQYKEKILKKLEKQRKKKKIEKARMKRKAKKMQAHLNKTSNTQNALQADDVCKLNQMSDVDSSSVCYNILASDGKGEVQHSLISEKNAFVSNTVIDFKDDSVISKKKSRKKAHKNSIQNCHNHPKTTNYLLDILESFGFSQKKLNKLEAKLFNAGYEETSMIEKCKIRKKFEKRMWRKLKLIRRKQTFKPVSKSCSHNIHKLDKTSESCSSVLSSRISIDDENKKVKHSSLFVSETNDSITKLVYEGTSKMLNKENITQHLNENKNVSKLGMVTNIKNFKSVDFCASNNNETKKEIMVNAEQSCCDDVQLQLDVTSQSFQSTLVNKESIHKMQIRNNNCCDEKAISITSIVTHQIPDQDPKFGPLSNLIEKSDSLSQISHKNESKMQEHSFKEISGNMADNISEEMSLEDSFTYDSDVLINKNGELDHDYFIPQINHVVTKNNDIHEDSFSESILSNEPQDNLLNLESVEESPEFHNMNSSEKSTIIKYQSDEVLKSVSDLKLNETKSRITIIPVNEFCRNNEIQSEQKNLSTRFTIDNLHHETNEKTDKSATDLFSDNFYKKVKIIAPNLTMPNSFSKKPSVTTKSTFPPTILYVSNSEKDEQSILKKAVKKEIPSKLETTKKLLASNISKRVTNQCSLEKAKPIEKSEISIIVKNVNNSANKGNVPESKTKITITPIKKLNDKGTVFMENQKNSKKENKVVIDNIQKEDFDRLSPHFNTSDFLDSKKVINSSSRDHQENCVQSHEIVQSQVVKNHGEHSDNRTSNNKNSMPSDIKGGKLLCYVPLSKINCKGANKRKIIDLPSSHHKKVKISDSLSTSEVLKGHHQKSLTSKISNMSENSSLQNEQESLPVSVPESILLSEKDSNVIISDAPQKNTSRETHHYKRCSPEIRESNEPANAEIFQNVKDFAVVPNNSNGKNAKEASSYTLSAESFKSNSNDFENKDNVKKIQYIDLSDSEDDVQVIQCINNVNSIKGKNYLESIKSAAIEYKPKISEAKKSNLEIYKTDTNPSQYISIKQSPSKVQQKTCLQAGKSSEELHHTNRIKSSNLISPVANGNKAKTLKMQNSNSETYQTNINYSQCTRSFKHSPSKVVQKAGLQTGKAHEILSSSSNCVNLFHYGITSTKSPKKSVKYMDSIQENFSSPKRKKLTPSLVTTVPNINTFTTTNKEEADDIQCLSNFDSDCCIIDSENEPQLIIID